MSRAASTTRESHSRIILVGDVGEHCHVDASFARSIIHAKNLFEAIGEISVAPAREPIALVVISPEMLNGASDQTLQRIRRIDPAVRLALLHHNGAAACPIAAEAFDAHLEAPVTEPKLRSVLRGEAPLENEQDKADARPRPAQASAFPTDGREYDEHAEAAAPVSSSSRPTPLGDTDLVNALLAQPHGLASLALDLIRQQTGWSDLTFDERIDLHTEGEVVRHGQQVFGSLRSNDAASHELARWADWLGHWLALERSHYRYRHLAFHDELTGAWNRRYFNAFLADSIERATPRRRPITVMVFDLDDFKQYNDRYGHAAGDEILRETVRLLTAVIRKGDIVCRIGGDEFAVIFADIEGPREPGSQHPESIETIAKRFRDEICRMLFPKLGIEAPGTMTISGGLATYPWDGHDPESLLRHADQLALESKRKGKNLITIGQGAQQDCCDPPPSL